MKSLPHTTQNLTAVRRLRPLALGSFLSTCGTATQVSAAWLVLGLTMAYSQGTLKGTIRDTENLPIEGATVVARGTNQYALTDEDGNFTLSVTQRPPFIIRISYVGFKPQDYQVLEFTNSALEIALLADSELEEVIVTARRRSETVQQVPIPISVVSGEAAEDAGAFTANRLKEMIPSVQLYTSNPRNTGINIRGLGSPFGLTNDGLDPGVGFYVDGVYYARPAAATLDFIDVEQIEVLRGPQGTLFGKNTTSGAFNITTRKPSFRPAANIEVSYGNYGFVQAKSSITGPLSRKIAARLSLSGTQRDGLIENVRTGKFTNDINNLGFRAQVLIQPSDKTSITVAADHSQQRPDGYAQVVAGVVETKRPALRQFNNIIADLNYTLPSLNAFDRKIDHDTPWKSGNNLGGALININTEVGHGTLTSTTAWRYWDWDPSNDRDFTGLQALTKSQNPATHNNWSQEVRYAGEFSSWLSGVAGLFFIDQEVTTNGTEESGSAQWRFSQTNANVLWQTPGLFEGYGINTQASIKSVSAAVFANVDWKILEGLHVLPGIRYNYDQKDVSYNRTAYGGLDTANFTGTTNEKVMLQSFKNSVYTSQAYKADADENNLTYQFTVSYQINKRVNAYATYSTSFKPVGVNVSGLPAINGAPATDLAVIKPEDVRHIEMGAKTSLVSNLIVNVSLFNTDIRNYQTNVQSPELGINRGYIANAERVGVRGAELDASFQVSKHFSLYAAGVFTDGRYAVFTNAPLPLEETGATVVVDGVTTPAAFKDISGGHLPGISRWAGSMGGELLSRTVKITGRESKFFLGFDSFYRSGFSSSPSPSQFLNIEGYVLLNARAGFRAADGLSFFVWGRNVLDKNYYEQLLVAGGNAGHFAGVLGDPATYGLTLRYLY